MARRSKRKKIKWLNICLVIFFLVLIGGFFLFNNKKIDNNDNKTVDIKDGNDVKVDKKIDNAPINHKDFLDIGDGEYLTSKGFTLVIKNGVSYIDNILIVNKTYSLPQDFKPVNPYEEVVGERCNNCIDKDAMNAFKSMQSDAQAIGLNIYISSGFRGYTYQDKIYNNYVAMSGKDKADTYSARPGHSEHQSGLCFDLNTIDDSFANTSEGQWVNKNASNYGFVIRYPKGKETITGYQYESWHLRYVGLDLAQKLYQDGDWMTLEEYYGISSKYE